MFMSSEIEKYDYEPAHQDQRFGGRVETWTARLMRPRDRLCLVQGITIYLVLAWVAGSVGGCGSTTKESTKRDHL